MRLPVAAALLGLLLGSAWATGSNIKTVVVLMEENRCAVCWFALNGCLMGVLSECCALSTFVHTLRCTTNTDGSIGARAFDHMLGWMKKTRPEIDGLTGNEFNLANPADPTSKKFVVSPDAEYVDAYDPDHSYEGTRDEIFGSFKWVGPPAPMSGFAMTNGRIGNGGMVMRGFTPDRVPIIATLANEFALFDR
jgi:hypothetical protein